MLVAAFVGAVVRMAAKRKEIAVAVTMSLILVAFSVVQFSIFAVHSVADGLFFLPQVVSNFASPIALIVGAGIVRKSRVSTHPKVWETTLPNVPSPFETVRAQGSKPGSVRRQIPCELDGQFVLTPSVGTGGEFSQLAIRSAVTVAARSFR